VAHILGVMVIAVNSMRLAGTGPVAAAAEVKVEKKEEKSDLAEEPVRHRAPGLLPDGLLAGHDGPSQGPRNVLWNSPAAGLSACLHGQLPDPRIPFAAMHTDCPVPS